MRETSYPESPCVGLCQLDRERGHCMGCGRTLDEISQWTRMDVDGKRHVIALATARLEAVPAATQRDRSA